MPSQPQSAVSRAPTHVDSQGEGLDPLDAPNQINVVSTLGQGRAATAELVDATWSDGRRQRCVEKVFDPGLLTRFIYRIAFAAPFAYQSNRHAILACFYRRRVAAKLLARQNCDVSVAQPLYVRYDQARQSWVLAAQWIQGRGPLPHFVSNQTASRDEMPALVNRMQTLEQHLIDWGLSGSGWQVSPRAMVSTANLLIVPPAKIKLLGAGDNNQYVVIDLESGIPAVLVSRYIAIAWKQGSLFPFDDLDAAKLRNLSDPSIIEDVEHLVAHNRDWKATELAFFRKPWTWFSRQRISQYREHCIVRWKTSQLTQTESVDRLASSRLFFLAFWLVGLFPVRSIASRLQSLLGRQDCRLKARRLITDPIYRADRFQQHRSKRIAKWVKQTRLSESVSMGSIVYGLHSIASAILPCGWHRFMCDSHRRRRRLGQFGALFFQPRYQSITARRHFTKTLRRWRSRQWIDRAEADRLQSQFSGPRTAIYSRGLTMHLGIKMLYPLMAPLKVAAVTMLMTGTNVWLWIIPFMLLPALRTITTLASAWVHRKDQAPHVTALLVGIIPTLGSSAFLIQMWTADREIFSVWIRELASGIGRRLPIYGGADSRTEHFALSLADYIAVSKPDILSVNSTETNSDATPATETADNEQRGVFGYRDAA